MSTGNAPGEKPKSTSTAPSPAKGPVPAGAGVLAPAPAAASFPATPAAPATPSPARPVAPRPASTRPATGVRPAGTRPAARPAGTPGALAKPRSTSTAIRPQTQTKSPAVPTRTRPPAGGALVPPPGAPGRKLFWVLFVVGLLLIGTGVGLWATFYTDVAQAKTAAQFLSDNGAQFIPGNPAVHAVELTAGSLKVGQSVMIKDTVASAVYNSSAGVTLLSFSSIAGEDSSPRAAQSPIAQALFGTIQGHVDWVTPKTAVVMSFTIVRAQLPGGAYSSMSYLTIDAAADATHTSLAPGGPTGFAAAAISPTYVEPNPNVQYDGLFYFLMAVGAVLVIIAVLWPAKVERWFRLQTKDPRHLVVGLTGITALLGSFFMPFYPWPIAFLIAGVVMLTAWKFPQLSLLVLVLFVVPEIAYQSGTLGFLFLFAVLPVLFAALIDWRFGLGALLTLFLAPIGLSFIGPIFIALVFSLYLGIAVAVVGGLLITLFVTLGNFPILGFLTGPGASSSPSLVSGHSAAFLPALPMEHSFTFNSIGNAYLNLLNPNFQVLAAGSTGIGGLAIPLAQIAAWCFVAWFVSWWLKDRERQTYPNLLTSSAISGAILAAVTAGGIAAFNYFSWAALAVILIIPATVTAVAGALVLRDVFEAYFTSRLGASSVGTRVAEMKGLQKITFEMVGGLHDVKADIKESMIIPLMRKDVTTRFRLEPPKGILLFGPPGCGKTMLMKALASELGVEMISIKCSDLMSKWYGESENRVADLLRTARERAPAILFMDEIDAIAKRRDMYTADDVTPRLLSILLSEMDGIDKSAGVIVVGSTNKPDLIDPALMRPGRLDKIIYVPPPDYNERMEIVHVHLQGRPIKGDIDLAEIAKKTERFSGADLANIVREAATLAVRREMMTQIQSPITMDDFLQVLPRIKPSISLRMISDYETMKMDYERKMHQVQRTERKVVVHWDDVGGLTEIKQAIREYVELPLTRPELMESYKIKSGRGILLFGPPGCGKTHIMRAAANELNVPMQIVSGPELVSALAGQSEAAVRDVLYRARENAPSIVFFDEIDALASKESMRTPEVSRAVSQFLTEMDGLRPKDKVIIIATTNRPQTLDPALLRPGRFDKIFYVPPPDLAARQDIFRIHMKGVPVEGTIDFGTLASRCDGFSGADIANCVDEAKLIALREQLVLEVVPTGAAAVGGLFTTGSDMGPAAKVEAKGTIAGLRMDNLVASVSKTKSSITPETLQWAQEFIRSYGTRG
ncbi:MAG: AAA family ATPase [Thermoplasmata archaeon]|nr:AAA family ATPase [Thermoplasmata archaeon]